jgi:hypothetical protein
MNGGYLRMWLPAARCIMLFWCLARSVLST